jgi:hypothetical protein
MAAMKAMMSAHTLKELVDCGPVRAQLTRSSPDDKLSEIGVKVTSDALRRSTPAWPRRRRSRSRRGRLTGPRHHWRPTAVDRRAVSIRARTAAARCHGRF